VVYLFEFNTLVQVMTVLRMGESWFGCGEDPIADETVYRAMLPVL